MKLRKKVSDNQAIAKNRCKSLKIAENRLKSLKIAENR